MTLSLHCSAVTPPLLPSFPTRRSSDLHAVALADALQPGAGIEGLGIGAAAPQIDAAPMPRPSIPAPGCRRSEEHTSELQSHSDLVCRLLLEKKKKYDIRKSNNDQVIPP